VKAALKRLAVTYLGLSTRGNEAFPTVERQLERWKRELAAFTIIASAVNRALTLDQILTASLDRVLDVLGGEGGLIRLLDEKTEELVLTVHRGCSQEFLQQRARVRWDETMLAPLKATGEALVIDDLTQADQASLLPAIPEGYRSYAGIPLRSGERTVGTLSVFNRPSGRFKHQDVQFLTAIGHQIGMAIGNVRLFQETERQWREAETLAEIGRDLNSSLELEVVLQKIVRAAQALCGSDLAYIATVDQSQEVATVVASVGVRTNVVMNQPPLTPGKGMGGQVLLTRQPFITDDYLNDPRLTHEYDANVTAEGLVTQITVPIFSREDIIGLLFAANRTPRPFSEKDQAILTTLANYAAIAMENARLYEQVTRHAAELEQKVEERTRALKEAQEELVKKERLAVLGQLAGGVGHELRNPLGVIKNSIYYLTLRLQDAEEKVKRHLSIMEREIRTANKITTDLLDFARSKEPSRMSTDLNKLVEEVFVQYPVEPQIELWTELDPHLPSVTIDKEQIQQVFLNLIVNAVQAMPQGGQLAVKTSVQRGFVVVSFTDTGSGIPGENLEKIFQPLFTTKAKGIGLGLAVSKSLVEANNGEITVESQRGRGTTFHVKFPTP